VLYSCHFANIAVSVKITHRRFHYHGIGLLYSVLRTIVLQDTLFFLRRHTDFLRVAHRSNLIDVLTLKYELTAAITLIFFKSLLRVFTLPLQQQHVLLPCCSLARKPSASQSRAPLQAAACESDAMPCTKVDLVHGVTTTRFVNFEFRRNTAIPIGIAEYCLKSGRIPPKSEWLAAMDT